jgi:hypothetical protein
MKRKYILILTGIVVAVLLVMTLLKASVKGMNIGRNGFVRKVSLLSVTKTGQRFFQQPVRDIAGVRGDSIFIVTAYPDKMIITNSDLAYEKTVDLHIASDKKLSSNFTTRLRFPDLDIFGSNIPCVIRYNLQTRKSTTYSINRAFSRGVSLSLCSIMIRGFDAQFKDEQIRKINLLTGTSTEEKGITDKTEGGGFVTDGMLHYDEYTNTIVYHHFYSNKILCIDTNLNLLQTGSSIDTFKTYTAKAAAITTSKGAYFTFTAPPKLLSWASCVDKGRLFIGSRLQADNEAHDRFINNVVIDVYKIPNTVYTGSLYIPVLPGKHLVKFEVLSGRLFMIYENTVVVYRIQ